MAGEVVAPGPRTGLFSGALFIIGGVATTVWASQNNKTGKGWWFAGGALAGGAVGGIVDYILRKK